MKFRYLCWQVTDWSQDWRPWERKPQKTLRQGLECESLDVSELPDGNIRVHDHAKPVILLFNQDGLHIDRNGHRSVTVSRHREKGCARDEMCGRIVWDIYVDLNQKSPAFLVGVNRPARTSAVFSSGDLEKALQFLSDIKKYL